MGLLQKNRKREKTMDYSKELKKFLYPGSPFIGTMQEDVRQKIRNEIVNESAPPVFTIAVELNLEAPVQVARVIAEIPKLLAAPEDTISYLNGLTIPLNLIFFAYGGIYEGARKTKRRIKEMISSEKRGFDPYRAYLLEHFECCEVLLRDEPTGADIFKHAKEHPFSRNIYYQVGLEAGKLQFLGYLMRAMGLV